MICRQTILLIALLIVGCEETTEPQDCAGVAGGMAVEDCFGVCGGLAILDSCAVCVGGDTNLTACTQDCAGEWGGSAFIDSCSVCGGTTTNTDNCPECDAGLEKGCDGICSDNPLVIDACGICGGNASTCLLDIDNNRYDTVQLGEQLWMAENLKVIHYNNGDEIPNGYADSDWKDLSTGAFSTFPSDWVDIYAINIDGNVSYEETIPCGDNCAEIYGNLYNWYAVNDSRGICPIGWHVPSEEEWQTLELFLGIGSWYILNTGNIYRGTNEASKLAGNKDLWMDGNLENNQDFGTSNFNALPGGERSDSGSFRTLTSRANFWTSSSNSIYTSWYRRIGRDDEKIWRHANFVEAGMSVRCLKD